MANFTPISPKEMLQAISEHEVFRGFDEEASKKLEGALSYHIVSKNQQVFETVSYTHLTLPTKA